MTKKIQWLSPKTFRAILDHPTIQMRVYSQISKDNFNPYYVWRGIELCEQHRLAYPPWIRTYLAECAQRLLSPEAAATHDIRKILPGVLGFDQNQSRENLLDPDRDDGRSLFCLRFAIELEQGHKPSLARANAAAVAFDKERVDKIDDKTLLNWLKDEFGIKSARLTTVEWKAIARRHYVEFAKVLFSKENRKLLVKSDSRRARRSDLPLQK